LSDNAQTRVRTVVILSQAGAQRIVAFFGTPNFQFTRRIAIMNGTITRRALMRSGLIAGALVPTAGLFVNLAASAASAVDPNDPTAKALGYVAQSPKADASCASCLQFQGKAGDATGPCTIFAGKNVASTGWCMSWAKKA
jgi:High potential iron-sulfur protein